MKACCRALVVGDFGGAPRVCSLEPFADDLLDLGDFGFLAGADI